MMTSLFSSFDPSTYILSFNWLSLTLFILIMPYFFWMVPSRNMMLWISIMKIMHKEMKILLPETSKGSTILFTSIFAFILINNFLGLFPYIFTATSHMNITLSMALPLWLSFMIFGWIKKTNYMFAHLTPQGTPPALMFFMVCIETISNLIRPGALAVRLSANMIAGHLLLTLLGQMGPMMNLISVWLVLFSQIILLILEMAVSVIQAYVFTVLASLYSKEVN
uniref:ATP synthase subunit a n=1 Tax=Downesia tarsata TaxID=2790390 RepID=A0A7T1FV33_9CUCU|nr:ATP synthase F0 subunit 6 [Downesia tarsata]QPM99429.1 ATP synthase F0 subunit 6 [Downesia tarsata]